MVKLLSNVCIKFDPQIENTLFELEIKFANSYVTNTAIRLSYSPLEGNDIIFSTINDVEFESIDDVKGYSIEH